MPSNPFPGGDPSTWHPGSWSSWIFSDGLRDLPITLPSLALAVLRLPVPMTEEDFVFLLDSLNRMRLKLTDSAPD